jgi:hypothetical protein
MSKNLLVAFVGTCVLCASAAVQANDGSIAVYLDAAGTQCEGNINGAPVTGSIFLNLAGATAGGITGAEFRVDNSDPNAYSVSSSPSPDVTIALGNPFVLGCNVSFQDCQVGPRVPLYSLVILEQAHTADVTLTVRQKYEPTNPSTPCALAILCDAPVYTSVCIGAPNSDHWRAVINPSNGISGDCQPVAVLPTSWSAVKSLYMN